MRAVSARWEPAVRDGGVAVKSKVEVYGYRGDVLASTEQAVAPFPRLQVNDGDVTVDVTAATRRRATITFNDPDGKFAPSLPTDLLANESAHEIRVWRGFTYPDGTEELVPLGVFGFADDDTEFGSGDQTVQVTLFDRARRLARAGFVYPYNIAKGSNYVDAISAMLRAGWGDIQISATPTGFTTPKLTYDQGDDRWKQATDMAEKIGYDLYFDVDGVCQLNPLVAVVAGAQPVFDYSEGANAVLLGGSRRASNDQGYNGVIETGASSTNGTPPRGEAWDTDPLSPTYSGYDPVSKTFGPSAYGAVPFFETSSLLTSRAQCDAAAAAKLLTFVGRHEQIAFDAIVNPAHDGRDLIRMKRAKAKIDAIYELQSFNVPLRADGTMKATTKQRKVA